jgi:pimeloyl-ACP methyl ester carboxylesterase
VAHARRAQQAIPDAELAVIPAAGHTAPVENPEAVTNALDAFITAHSAPLHRNAD